MRNTGDHHSLPLDWYRAFTMPHEHGILVGPQYMGLQQDLKPVQGNHVTSKTMERLLADRSETTCFLFEPEFALNAGKKQWYSKKH